MFSGKGLQLGEQGQHVSRQPFIHLQADRLAAPDRHDHGLQIRMGFDFLEIRGDELGV